VLQVVTPPTEVSTIASTMTKPFVVTGVEVAYLPITPLRLPAEEGENDGQAEETMGEVISEDLADKVFGLVEGLEDTGDVVKVWTNVAGVQ
jgi:transcriptional/translational regulatory protein YebC/TACO1